MFNKFDVMAIYFFLLKYSSLRKPYETNNVFGDDDDQREFDDYVKKWMEEISYFARQNNALKNFQRKMFMIFFYPVEQIIASIDSRANSSLVDIEWYRRGQVISAEAKMSEIFNKSFMETFLSGADRSRIRRMMFLNFVLKILYFCHHKNAMNYADKQSRSESAGTKPMDGSIPDGEMDKNYN